MDSHARRWESRSGIRPGIEYIATPGRKIKAFALRADRKVDHGSPGVRGVFLRELISNASDALDRLRFEGLTRPELLTDHEPNIRIERDKERRTLSIVDDGIGMSREEVERDIGTIARSGTAEFLKTALEGRDTA